jgi:hypothetical protein
MACMFRGPDWNQTYAAVTAHLEPDERPVTLFTALIPPPESGGVVIAGELAPLVWAVWHATWRHKTRAASRSADVPLAPRMIIAVTSRRLVIWAASRRWRLGKVVGDLLRDRITGITKAASGTRSQTLMLHLSTGPTVTIMVAAATADSLASVLSLQPTTPPPARLGTPLADA